MGDSWWGGCRLLSSVRMGMKTMPSDIVPEVSLEEFECPDGAGLSQTAASTAGDTLRRPRLEPTSGLPQQAARQGCGCSAGLSQAGLGGTNQLRQLRALVSGPAGLSGPAGPSQLQLAPGSASLDPHVFPSGLPCPSVSLPCLHPKVATPTPSLSSPSKDCSSLLGPPVPSARLSFFTHSLTHSVGQ